MTQNCPMDEEGAGSIDYDSCEYNKTHVFNEVCSYFNTESVCGRNCTYSDGVNVTCSTNFTICTYSLQTYVYECVYDKNYVLSSACGYDINHAMICGNDCTHKYGNETIDCKTTNTSCSFDEWGSTLCHCNISTNSQQVFLLSQKRLLFRASLRPFKISRLSSRKEKSNSLSTMPPL